MASSTPSHCPISAPKPYQNLHNPQTNAPHRRQNNQKWSSRKFTLGTQSSTTRNPANSGTTTPISDTNPNFPPFPSFSPSKSELGHEFRGRRSTRFVSKMHFGRPKTLSNSRHTSAAEEALQQILHCNRDRKSIDYVLRSYELRLCSPDDYTFLLRELGNRGECSMAMQCFEFAIRREERRIEQGKLASAVISVLGRLGRVDLAKRVFETAYSEGYGNTVYAFSALISAYGRSGRSKEAIEVFESMKDSGLKPNLVTYNAVIDACGKGGMEFNRVTEMFDEMVSNGVQPDRITFNSLIAVCSREGWWEAAQNMFNQMVCRGIERDMYTYNTLLDAICKGGRLDLAFDVMSEMTEKNMSPNVVTYSTMIDGLAKAGKLDEALNLFNEMKLMGIGLDRVMYNTLLGIYARLGRLEEALEVCDEMDKAEIKKDIVSYNALLGGYGKQGKFDKVKEVFEELRAEHVHPNVLTYSTLIDVYLKGGLYREALETFREFQQIGLKADVVLYSGLIDALCKIGQVESAVSLLDGMARIGIQPNIVTYNSIIDAFGQPETLQFQKDALDASIEGQTESSTYIGFESAIERSETNLGDRGIDKRILMILEKLAAENMCPSKEDAARKSQILCILEVFQKMHQLQIKPNVVTFSAILNACSRCNSFGDASMLLEELRLFDNQVYGVAHGLLMGCREKIWVEAQSLFDEVKCMDSATSSAFYNALTDLLWHFGQRRGAQLVVLEGKRRHVWENVWCDACLDLHLMSSGAAQAMVHAWLLDIRSVVFEGRELPRIVSILTGWGKHSKVAGDGTLRRSIEALLTGIGAPFHVTNCNLGRFISKGSVVAAWLRESGTLKVLILHDERTNPESEALKQPSNLQVLPL